MRRLATLLVAGLLTASLGGTAVAGTSGGGMGKVSVVHAVPDLTVDVYLNDALAIEDFAPGTIQGPIKLPSGMYDVDIRPADADPSSDPAISRTFRLRRGRDLSWVAHLDADGDPTLSRFHNNVRPTTLSRLVVRHVAAAPAVDVWANGMRIARRLENGEKAGLRVPPGVYAAWVSLPGDHEPVIGPEVLRLRQKRAYFVYAWGSAADGYELLVQVRRVA